MAQLVAANFWPFLIYWLAMFVACYTVVDVAQDQLYDEVTPYAGLKVAAGSAIIAVFLTWLRPSYESMFTTHIAWTTLQGIVWFAVFTLIFRFHPQHGAALGILTMLLVTGLATMGVESLTNPSAKTATARPLNNPEPIRRPMGTPTVPAAGTTPAKK
jgi:hypothetical protein